METEGEVPPLVHIALRAVRRRGRVSYATPPLPTSAPLALPLRGLALGLDLDEVEVAFW